MKDEITPEELLKQIKETERKIQDDYYDEIERKEEAENVETNC